MVKNPPANPGDTSSIPETGRSPDFPEKGAATHSSVLAWTSPWTRSLVGYAISQSDMTEATEHAHTNTPHSMHKKVLTPL